MASNGDTSPASPDQIDVSQASLNSNRWTFYPEDSARLGYPNLLIMFAGGVLFVIGRGIDRSYRIPRAVGMLYGGGMIGFGAYRGLQSALGQDTQKKMPQ